MRTVTTYTVFKRNDGYIGATAMLVRDYKHSNGSVTYEHLRETQDWEAAAKATSEAIALQKVDEPEIYAQWAEYYAYHRY